MSSVRVTAGVGMLSNASATYERGEACQGRMGGGIVLASYRHTSSIDSIVEAMILSATRRGPVRGRKCGSMYFLTKLPA